MKKSSEKNPSPPFDAELNHIPEENSDSRWNRVYASVILTTVLVIAALWLFSRYFSK